MLSFLTRNFHHCQFLNRALGPNTFQVGDKLASCTSTFSSRAVLHAPGQRTMRDNMLPGRHIVLVDTPGLDDTQLEDIRLLGRVSEWLKAT